MQEPYAPSVGGRSQAPGPFGSTTPSAGQSVQDLVAAILGLNQYERGVQGMAGQAAAAAPASNIASMRAGVGQGPAMALGGQSLAASAPPEISTSEGLLDAHAGQRVSEFQSRRMLEEYLRLMAANDPSFLEKYGTTIATLLGGAGGFALGGPAGAAFGSQMAGGAATMIGGR